VRIKFNSRIKPRSLQEHCETIGWDDCSTFEDGVFRYMTRSGSATLVVNDDGTGAYEGQRSLLFSHSIFSRLPRAWLNDELEVVEMKSRDSNIPPFIYFGECYMKDLRMKALEKGLASIKREGCPENYFIDFVKRVLAIRRELVALMDTDHETDRRVSRAITTGLKQAYLTWVNTSASLLSIILSDFVDTDK